MDERQLSAAIQQAISQAMMGGQESNANRLRALLGGNIQMAPESELDATLPNWRQLISAQDDAERQALGEGPMLGSRQGAQAPDILKLLQGFLGK